MPEYVGTIFIIVLLLVITAIIMAVSRIRSQKRLRDALSRRFGAMPELDPTAEEYESIARYSMDHVGDAFYIDDTTWNDLSMDRIFSTINNCVSSCGEDVLYHMLRVPTDDKSALEERNEAMAYVTAQEEKRLDLLCILAKTGRKRGKSHYAFVKDLEDAKPVKTALYVALLLLMVVDIVLFFLYPAVAVALLLVLVVVNVRLHLQNADTLRMYVQGFNSILLMRESARDIVRMDLPVFLHEQAVLRTAIRDLQGFARGSYFVTSAGQIGTGIGDAIMEYIKMFFHVDMLKFNQMLSSYRDNEAACDDLVTALGTIDAMISCASYRAMLPVWCRVEEGDEDAILIEDMIHPLVKKPVPNSVTVSGGNLVTGSNASGKSTFLKGIALCAILGWSIDTVPAKRYHAPYYKVLTSMALSDDLAAKESYFVVELKSIGRILEEADKGERVLCVVDEVLRGTNTIERIAASSEILHALSAKENVIVLAATHDGELTKILSNHFRNLHFEEKIEDDKVTFDYMLREGPSTTRNAIALLAVMEFPDRVVDGARSRAAAFEQTGEWEVMA